MEKAKTIRFRSALVENQWQENVSITIRDGRIESINSDATVDQDLDFVALPGMPNLHSHAFQRGFTGLSEYQTAEHDSFWTWRRLMYQFLLHLNPDDVYVIAKQLYLEMLQAGYTWVGEFHYLHNANNGSCYANLSEMSEAISRAAHDAGIGLCHLPVLYQRGGFENEPLSEGQKRFALTSEQFVSLVESLNSKKTSDANFTLGIALHSLRAVDATTGVSVVEQLRRQYPDMPVHIHVAEQVKEVEDCLQVHNQRSVEYLFNNYEVDANWCLIHATHLNDAEINMIAQSGAVAGLCPTTEANLGDGFFSAREYLNQKGAIGIGSDSHCSVDFRDELRTLEYGQRLQRKSRAVLGEDAESVGRNLYRRCAEGGAKALGIGSGQVAVGERADFCLIDPEHPSIALATEDRLLDRVVFTNTGSPIAGVVVAGQTTLIQSDEFQSRFRESTQKFNQVCRSLSEI